MANATLHPTHGVSPRTTYCPVCGAETNKKAYGWIRRAILPDGGRVFATKGKEAEAENGLLKNKRLTFANLLHWEDVPPGESIPLNAPCEKCQAQAQANREEVARGGLFFICEECTTSGVLSHTSEYAKETRERLGKPPPELLRITFHTCEQHGGSFAQRPGDFGRGAEMPPAANDLQDADGGE